jgi:hypothetical protein
MDAIGRLFAALALASCAVAPPPQRASVAFAAPWSEDPLPTPRATMAILVTLDGTRWQEVFGDEPVMPTLRRWMATDGASIGAPGHGEIRASGPNYVSLPGYTEIFTGRKSACATNWCAPVTEPTLVDEVIDSGATAAVVSSWETIDRAAARLPARAILSTGRRTLAHAEAFDAKLLEAGSRAEPWPGVGEYRPDEHTMRVALGLVATRRPKFVFVGLGDTDEHAHRDEHVKYIGALRAADDFLAALEVLAGKDAVILVTADHGRAANFRDHGGEAPESGRVWLVAKGAGIDARGAIDAGARHLSDVAPTIRCLLGMPRVVAAGAGSSIPQLCAE